MSETLGICSYMYQLSNETSPKNFDETFPKRGPLHFFFYFRPVCVGVYKAIYNLWMYVIECHVKEFFVTLRTFF